MQKLLAKRKNPELRLAAECLMEKYRDATLNAMLTGFEKLYDYFVGKAVGEVTKALFEQVSGVGFTSAGFLYNVINFSLDVAMKLTGYEKRANSLDDFNVQMGCYQQTMYTYQNAFQRVFDGDHSDAAINRLIGAFTVAKSSCLRIHNTALALCNSSSMKNDITAYINQITDLELY